jgi:hypothetical protein
LEKTKSI